MQDLDRMRSSLNISPFGRIAVIMGVEDGKLTVNLECIACEGMLEWDRGRAGWSCPHCLQDLTEAEAGDLFTACHEVLGRIIGWTDEGAPQDDVVPQDEGTGQGRWRDRMRALMGV